MMLAAFAAASCYSSDYREETTTNVKLITAMSDKLADYCRAGFLVNDRPISEEEMGEFYYALKKGRSFADMTAEHYGTLQSHRDMVTLLSTYQTFVDQANRYRLSANRDPAELAGLINQHDTIAQLGEIVIDDLPSEPD